MTPTPANARLQSASAVKPPIRTVSTLSGMVAPSRRTQARVSTPSRASPATRAAPTKPVAPVTRIIASLWMPKPKSPQLSTSRSILRADLSMSHDQIHGHSHPIHFYPLSPALHQSFQKALAQRLPVHHDHRRNMSGPS